MTDIIVIDIIYKESVMDGVINVAQQHTQVGTNEIQGTKSSPSHIEHAPKVDLVKEMQKEITDNSPKIDSKKDVESLVSKLNDSMAPMNADIKFGVDRDDIFYVSVIDTKSDKIIRRFPAEKAISVLDNMNAVTGILFDSKG